MKYNNDLGREFFNKKRYPALRTVAIIYIVYAIIIGIMSISLMFKFLNKGDVWLAFSALIGGSVLILMFIAISESIKVFLDIEYNTRKALDPLVFKKEKQNEKDIDNRQVDFISENIKEEVSITAKESDKIEELNSLIENQKGKMFGGNNRDKIIEITMTLCENKEYAENLLLYYENNFDKDLLNELKSLSSSYNVIKSYLLPFIDLNIIKEDFPHDKI